MKHQVLAIGYKPCDYDAVRTMWQKYGMEFDFVDDIAHAEQYLLQGRYVGVAVCTDDVQLAAIDAFRNSCPVPIMVVPKGYSASQRFHCAQFCATQYMKTVGYELNGRDNMQFFLDTPSQTHKPLTIVTFDSLCLCVESRTVEVCGQAIYLTAKEFDALCLLIANQKRVLTFEIISVRVWGEEYSDNSPKAVSNLISRLRQKLKVAPDVPDYIKSIHGVGYKFDALT